MVLTMTRWEREVTVHAAELTVQGHATITWDPHNSFTKTNVSTCSLNLPYVDDLEFHHMTYNPLDVADESGFFIAREAYQSEVRRRHPTPFDSGEIQIDLYGDTYILGPTTPTDTIAVWIQGHLGMIDSEFDIGPYRVAVTTSPICTAGIEITVASTDEGVIDHDQAKKIADSFSDLVSISQGCTTAWSRIDGVEEGSSIWSILRSHFTEFPRGGLDRPLIETHIPGIFQEFVTQSWQPLHAMCDEERQLWRDLHDFIVYADNSYYPVPFMILYSAVEMVTTTDLILSWKRTSYLDRDKQKQFHLDLQTLLESYNIYLPESELKDKSRALLMHTFRHRARVLFDHFGLSVSEHDLQQFAHRRNSTHNRYTYQKDDRAVLSRFTGYMERLVLKRLKYTGPFVDYTAVEIPRADK